MIKLYLYNLFIISFLFNLLISSPLIDNYANAQVSLNACGTDNGNAGSFMTKNCTNKSNSSKSSTSSYKFMHLTDKDVCYRATVINNSNKSVKWETNPNYASFVTEAQKRGLSCGVNKNFEEEVNKGNIKNPLSEVQDNIICNRASEGNIEYILEAKRRGLNECINQSYYLQIKQREKEEREKRIKITNLSNDKVCKKAIIVKRKPGTHSYIYAWNKDFGAYIEEAKLRGLNCGVKVDEAEKKRVVEEKVRKEKEIQEKLERAKRIKAEQEKIKKTAKELALKEKKAKEEKFKKENIARIKREAKKRNAEEKLKNKIKAYKDEATYFYQDITDFVKSGSEIDLLKLSEFFSTRPKTNKKWNKKDTENYENLKSYLNNNQAFIDFEKRKKEARIAKANTDKSNTINSLNNNLKKLNSLIRENFGNDKAIQIIQSNIKKTKSILDGNFNQKKANKVLSDVNGYLSNYFDNKNKLKELNDYLNNKKLALTDILKNNFGTEKANTASKLISDIEKTKTVASKKQLKDKIDIFIKNPSEGIKKVKKINKENKLKQKFSDLLDNQICNNATRGNKWISGEKDLIAEANRRGLDCGVKTNLNSKIGNLKNKVIKELGPCSNVTSGWGKTKCLALLNILPLRFVCEGMKIGNDYNGALQVNIKNHDDISFKSGFLGEAKVINNNFLTNGILSFDQKHKVMYKNQNGFLVFDKKKSNSVESIKVKISLLAIEYEQQINGDYVHSGYCKKRL